MLGKVLKYDLKRLGQSLTPLYIITLILSIVVLGGSYLTDINQLFSIAYGAVLLFFILLLMAVGIGTFFISIQKFYQNLLKDEGYLTNTLPVTKNTLILSKILSSCIFMAISLIVIAIALCIAFAKVQIWTIVPKLIQFGLFSKIMGMKEPLATIIMVFMIIISYVVQLLFFYFAIALGQRHNTNRLLYSFVYGLVLYSIQQVVSLIFLGVFILINPDVVSMLNNQVSPSVSILGVIYVGSMIISIVIGLIYYFGTVYIFNKKLNLE